MQTNINEQENVKGSEHVSECGDGGSLEMTKYKKTQPS